MNTSPKYQFSWNLIGDLKTGRPNLGRLTRLEVYRLMQYSIRDVLEKNYGSDTADRLFFEAGKLAGEEFYQNILGTTTDFDSFIKRLQETLLEMSIGILRLEEVDRETGDIIISIAEDLDCSGLPELSYAICTYDEGFFSGILEKFSGHRYEVKEIECWCTGNQMCRFKAQRIG